MKIGLTGGMGCGKSTVAALFRKKGFATIDADAIVRELLSSDADTIVAVAELFGSDVVMEGGGVDRAKVGERAFADDRLLDALEKILHPKVRASWESALSAGGDWVVEIPLLFEKKLQNIVDLTVCVFSDLETQLSRLASRGIDRVQAQARINRQMPLSEKAELADYVLLNDGSLEFLEEQVDRLITDLKTQPN